MGMMQEFKEFAVKGNVIDLAVGVIIGGAFGKIVDSVVGDLIMPVVGAVFGKLDFSSLFVVLGNVPPGTAMTLDALKKAGRAGFRLRQLHHGGGQFRHPGVHHFPDGQADQPPQARSPCTGTGARRTSRKTCCCCARSATASGSSRDQAPGGAHRRHQA
jgi:hypothetical protein